MPLFPKNKNKAVQPAPTAFKMRSGNGPLQFKQMGASPANFGKGFGDNKLIGDDFGKNKMNDVKASKNVMGDLASDKDKVKIKTEELKGPSDKTKKNIAEDKASIDKQASEVGKKEEPAQKKGLWQRYKDHVGSEDYHKTKDSFNELANVVDKSTVRKTDSAKNFKADKKADADAKAKETATADANKKDAINAAQKAEMHKSKLAVNEQNIARSKALEKQTEQGVKVAEDNISGENELGADDDESTKIIKGGRNLNTNA